MDMLPGAVQVFGGHNAWWRITLQPGGFDCGRKVLTGYRFIKDLTFIRRRQVVGGRAKPDHDTWGTLRARFQPTRLFLGV